jgi:putative transposase
MLKGYKYRLYPTKEQATLINKHIGSCRFIYNLALEVKNCAYATQRKNVTCFDLMNQLPDLKSERKWLNEVDSQALQHSVIDLDKAFTQFFKGHAGFPKFKSKYNSQSFRNPHGNKVMMKDGRLFQPKFTKQGIKIVMDRGFKGEIRSTAIRKAPTGKYFVSILVDNKKSLPKLKKIKQESSVGIDLGIKSFIVTSDGLKTGNPRHLQKSLSHVKYLGRQHSKKKKGGQNRKKSQFRLALCHEKITDQRKGFLHKLSAELIKNHDTLCFETLKIENMVKNHTVAQAVQSAG